MLLEDITTTYGTFLEIEREEYEVLPCPNCHEENTAKVTLHLEHEPAGYGIKCIKCGYEIPEEYYGYSFDHDHGVKTALDYWNTMAYMHELQERTEKEEEEERRIAENFIMKVNRIAKEQEELKNQKKDLQPSQK